MINKDYTVYGTDRRTASTNFWRIEELVIKNHPNFHLVEYDLHDLESSIRLLQKIEATEVYNLAAQRFVAVSFENPPPRPKNANIYGNATEGVLSEATPPNPVNDYAVALYARYYRIGSNGRKHVAQTKKS